MKKYIVVQALGSSVELVLNGRIISRHNSIDAASAKITKEIRALQRQPGMERSYYDWQILVLENGVTRFLTASELGSR